LVVFPTNLEILRKTSHRNVILKQTMITKRVVSRGNAKKRSLDVADRSTFPTTTDPVISIPTRLRDLPYLCMTRNPHLLLTDALAAFSGWISGFDGKLAMMAERVRIAK
jgi:hypothetical protein